MKRMLVGIMLGIMLLVGCAAMQEAAHETFEALKPETKADWLFLAELALKAVRSEDARWEAVQLVGDRLTVDLFNPSQEALEAIQLWKDVVEELAGRSPRSPEAQDPRVGQIVKEFSNWKSQQ